VARQYELHLPLHFTMLCHLCEVDPLQVLNDFMNNVGMEVNSLGYEPEVISKTVGDYDALLTPQHFIRTHKSHLVNKKFISFIDHDGFAILKDGSKIEVSRRRKEEVMAALK
jgi:hypothetical protein